MSKKALHLDNGKPPLAMVPRALVEEVARVLQYGATKYELHNWRKGSTVITFLNSALRHIFRYLDGETYDGESGLNHLSHAACNLGFLLQWERDGVLEDNRYHRKTNGATLVIDAVDTEKKTMTVHMEEDTPF